MRAQFKYEDKILTVEHEFNGVFITYMGKRDFVPKGTRIYEEVTAAINKRVNELEFVGGGVKSDGRRFLFWGNISDIELKGNRIVRWIKKLFR